MQIILTMELLNPIFVQIITFSEKILEFYCGQVVNNLKNCTPVHKKMTLQHPNKQHAMPGHKVCKSKNKYEILLDSLLVKFRYLRYIRNRYKSLYFYLYIWICENPQIIETTEYRIHHRKIYIHISTWSYMQSHIYLFIHIFFFETHRYLKHQK